MATEVEREREDQQPTQAGARETPLRVAILIRKWSTAGGNERVALELGRFLVASGHRVEVYCQKSEPTTVSRLPEAVVHRLLGPSFDPTLAMLSFAWSSARAIRRLHATRAIDVAIGFNHSVLQDVYRLGGGTQAEFLELTKSEPGARGGPVLDRAALELERIRFRPDRTSVLIAPSERVREELRRHYAIAPERIEVIPNGVDRSRFHPDGSMEERAAMRAEWGARPDETLLLFTGQDPERKGIEQAIEVAREVGARLVYVGKAPRPRSLPPWVIWDRHRSDIERCYRAADVLIAPSFYDPFGGAVLEAACSGLPAVATRRIGSTERLLGTPAEALLVEEPRDVAALVRAVRLALDPTARSGLKEALHSATRTAGRDEWGTRMEAVLRTAAGRRRRSVDTR